MSQIDVKLCKAAAVAAIELYNKRKNEITATGNDNTTTSQEQQIRKAANDIYRYLQNLNYINK